ncbi:hypothetical protein K0M31_005574 [Melipona bicolor]|uniref:Uncharacterized protein n=1 Tax=Melipona bicolor TaxID=60889 RepID=A0AA40KMU8_9HYME|nr:hypothetical protein K0M31_005574 [Melipona bicolor]
MTMENFDKLFKLIEKEWAQLKLNNELHVLEEVVIEGNKMGQLYRSEINIQYTINPKYLDIS